MGQVLNPKTENNTFTKKIGQTTYVVRFHYSENARETMQEKINRMLVNEVNRSDFMETEEKMQQLSDEISALNAKVAKYQKAYEEATAKMETDSKNN